MARRSNKHTTKLGGFDNVTQGVSTSSCQKLGGPTPQSFSHCRCANSNPPTSAVTASALPLSEPLHEQSHAVCTPSTLLLSLPACSLSCLALYHHTAAARGYVIVCSGILPQQLGAWGCSRTQFRLAIFAACSKRSLRARSVLKSHTRWQVRPHVPL